MRRWSVVLAVAALGMSAGVAQAGAFDEWIAWLVRLLVQDAGGWWGIV